MVILSTRPTSAPAPTPPLPPKATAPATPSRVVSSEARTVTSCVLLPSSSGLMLAPLPMAAVVISVRSVAQAGVFYWSLLVLDRCRRENLPQQILWALQWAKWLSAETIAVVSDAGKGETARSAGADHVIGVENFREEARALTDGRDGCCARL